MEGMFYTPQYSRKLSSASPSQTPRSDRGRAHRGESRVVEDLSNRFDKDKGVNVQVILRCRPFSEDELRANVPQVISCHEQRREVTVFQSVASKLTDRTFTFDKVFGPKAQQRNVYDQAIVPIVNEVLEGYNCTIFAYGQTGTGKTYTMEGVGRKTKNGDLPSDAGVIPRAVRQIIETLESQSADYSMKVTFLELYNEEITDLLATEDSPKNFDDKSKKSIALLEDGKGGVLVRGLEEEIVYSANEIYNLIERGSSKRRTAETLLSKQSRDSKLTRLLRDSLGGKTKTCIIATVSPSVHCLEETLSTLDYACRAKHIRNKPENKLEDTEEVLRDLQEKNRQANYALKEKEFYISNLLQSEKSLVEQALHLRSELEIAAQDVDRLFAEIDRKNEIETGNQNLVQTFKSQLLQHLELLHSSVVDSVSQQRQQLKNTEEQLVSFVSTKNQATEGMKNRVERLKTIYYSGIKGLHNLVNELDEKTLATFGRVNLAVDSQASDLNNLLENAVTEADAILFELQNALAKQEEKMSSYASPTTRESLKLDHSIWQGIEPTIAPCTNDLVQLQNKHNNKVEDITKDTNKYLGTEYM
ncbi:hypothetical protein KI387_006528, partial [Taxus chinensis]